MVVSILSVTVMQLYLMFRSCKYSCTAFNSIHFHWLLSILCDLSLHIYNMYKPREGSVMSAKSKVVAWGRNRRLSYSIKWRRKSKTLVTFFLFVLVTYHITMQQHNCYISFSKFIGSWLSTPVIQESNFIDHDHKAPES